jgi:hypothetical protein
MTATKLLKAYVYRDGEWEESEPHFDDYNFELWNGSHNDDVHMFGYEDGGNRRVDITVKGAYPGVPGDTSVLYHSRYSAAYKWSYAHAVFYGDPTSRFEPHVVVLEIAEDAYRSEEGGDPEYEEIYGPVSPYLVYVDIGFTTHTVFVDTFPDLVGLLGEVLPLVGNPTPRETQLYALHKWERGWEPLMTRDTR